MSRGPQIKKEEIELYKFYFSDKNLNARTVSKRVRNILVCRYDDQMTYTAIAEKLHTTPVKIRTEIRLFRRKATIAKWYTDKVNAGWKI